MLAFCDSSQFRNKIWFCLWPKAKDLGITRLLFLLDFSFDLCPINSHHCATPNFFNFLHIYISIYLSITISLFPLSIYLSFTISLFPLSIYHSFYLSLFLSITLSIYHSIFPSFYLLLYLSIVLPIHISLNLSI